jgi:SulP family sulfate permease
MVEIHNVRSVVRATRSDAVVFALTALATVVFDLIVAVEIGIAVAAFLALRTLARTNLLVGEPGTAPAGEITTDLEAALLAEHIVTYRIDGALFFGAAQRFLTELTAVSDVEVVILRLPQLQMLDATGAHALGEIVAELEARHITVLLKGPRPEHLDVLRAVGALEQLAHERHCFETLDAALVHARVHVHRALHPKPLDAA